MSLRVLTLLLLRFVPFNSPSDPLMRLAGLTLRLQSAVQCQPERSIERSEARRVRATVAVAKPATSRAQASCATNTAVGLGRVTLNP